MGLDDLGVVDEYLACVELLAGGGPASFPPPVSPAAGDPPAHAVVRLYETHCRPDPRREPWLRFTTGFGVIAGSLVLEFVDAELAAAAAPHDLPPGINRADAHELALLAALSRGALDVRGFLVDLRTVYPAAAPLPEGAGESASDVPSF